MWPFRNRDIEQELRVRSEHDSFISAYNNLLVELFADRGMLLGSQRYQDMTGVERFDALHEIDSRILQVKDLIKKEGERCKTILKSM